MTFFGFFNEFALLQLNYENKLNSLLPYGHQVIDQNKYNDHFDVVTFSNETDLVRKPTYPPVPAVNGDFIYFFPIVETRPVGVVYNGIVFDLKFQLRRNSISLWMQSKDGQRHDFMVPEVFNVLLITECHRKYRDRMGVVLWCKQ